jgi:Domain of unknown function (DUF4266)
MKYINRVFRFCFFIIAGTFLLQSCTAPKAYQKIYLNDSEMELAPKKSEKFEMNFQSYREGASGTNGGKTGGGCGCN